ncbi:MAG: glycine cleavage system protein GcvH [Acidobacteriota bacterium]
MYPDNLRYTKDHEWIEASGETPAVGVTHFAQKELGDVVFVELPEVGRKLSKGEEFGSIESVKAVSEIYSPVSGEVIAINESLRDHPEQVNEQPYGSGWIMKMRLSDPQELASLMDSRAYREHLGKSGH